MSLPFTDMNFGEVPSPTVGSPSITGQPKILEFSN